MRTSLRWGELAPILEKKNKTPSYSALSPLILSKPLGYSLTHKHRLLRRREGEKRRRRHLPSWFPVRISCEQLCVIAARPLSHHRHERRNPQPFVYRRAPVYGLMVILVVRPWHEPDSQLLAWAWHWGGGDRWQPNAFYCPAFTTCVDRITHAHYGDYVHDMSLSLARCPPLLPSVCVCVCAHIHGGSTQSKCLCVCVCAPQSVILPHCALTQRLELQVAPGVWEQLTSCWCFGVRRTHACTYIHSTCTHNCIFVHSSPCTCLREYMRSRIGICFDMSRMGLQRKCIPENLQDTSKAHLVHFYNLISIATYILYIWFIIFAHGKKSSEESKWIMSAQGETILTFRDTT